MLEFFVRRLATAVPLWLLVSVMAFGVMHLANGNPAAMMLGETASPAQVAHLSAEMGLDKPLVVQYLDWLGSALRGSLGQSFFLQEPVTKALLQRLPVTGSLTVMAMIIALVLSLPAGIMAAVRRGSIYDQLVMLLSTAGMAMPEFWFGLLLILLLAVQHPLFPVMGYVSFATSVPQWFMHIILPAFVVGFIDAAPIARMTRGTVIDALRSDYVRTARAKGLTWVSAVLKHGVRNALIPILTVVGVIFATLLGGVFVTEMVFNIPGIGLLMIQAVQERDFPLIQGGILFVATAVIVVNILVDFLYALVDPRVEYR